jgi:hypothetical protein
MTTAQFRAQAGKPQMKIFHITVATLVGTMAVFGTIIATAPSRGGENTDCENPSAIHTLKDLARSKLSDPSSTKYLLGDHVRPALAPSRTGTAEEFRLARVIQEIVIAGQLVVSSGQGTLVLTPLAIRHQGSLANGRTCAAFMRVAAPSMGSSTPALTFEIATSYSVERTNDGQVVVSASFSPK